MFGMPTCPNSLPTALSERLADQTCQSMPSPTNIMPSLAITPVGMPTGLAKAALATDELACQLLQITNHQDHDVMTHQAAVGTQPLWLIHFTTFSCRSLVCSPKWSTIAEEQHPHYGFKSCFNQLAVAYTPFCPALGFRRCCGL